MIHIDSAGRGPDVVLLHGWGLHGGVWERVAERLSDDFCVHRVDLPGHGNSAAVTPFTLDAVTQAVSAPFPLPVHVVGWSLGGLIAQQWALSRPEAVKSLALVATSPHFVKNEDWPHAQPAAQIAQVAASLDTDFDGTLQRFLALQTLGAPDARATLATMRDMLFSHGRPQALLPALQLLIDADLRPSVGGIACPAGLFFGARDAITPIGAGRWLAGQLPDAELVEFAKASHAPFLSHEDDFVAALRDFLLRQV